MNNEVVIRKHSKTKNLVLDELHTTCLQNVILLWAYCFAKIRVAKYKRKKHETKDEHYNIDIDSEGWGAWVG